MKFKYKLAIFAVIFTLLFSFSICAFAEPEGEGEDGEQVYTEEQIETEAPTAAPIETEPETEPQTEAPQTEPQTDPQTEEDPETEPETDPQTEEETQATEAETERQTKAIAAIQDYEDLPSAPVDEEPTAVSTDLGDDGDMTYGLASWVCVIIGVLTIVIVVISNKTHYIGGVGKPRYSEGNRITGQQKHLLDDNYYNTRKYSSYIDKDPRR